MPAIKTKRLKLLQTVARNNLIQRTITGAVFVVLVVLSIMWGKWYFAALMLITALLSVVEFMRMFVIRRQPVLFITGLAGTALVFSSFSAIALLDHPPVPVLISVNLLVLPLLLIVSLYLKGPGTIVHLTGLFTGIIYTAIPLALLVFLLDPVFMGFSSPHGILLGFFIMTWTNDTMAYLVGINFGKRKLFERLSPLKTWEGTMGGVVFTCLAAWVLWQYFGQLALVEWLGMALIVSVAGIYGDLAESMMKRSQNIKDSGSIFPGHGGVLDRFDAILLAAPFVYFYFQIIL